MKIKDWLYVMGAIISLITVSGSALVWAGDRHWVTQDSMKIKEIRDLDREITQIKIKERNNEATRSEIDYADFLKQQKRALEQEIDQ